MRKMVRCHSRSNWEGRHIHRRSTSTGVSPSIWNPANTYIRSGKLEHWVEICNIPHLRSEILTRPNFAFDSQTRGHIYVDWAESPEKRLGSGSFKDRGILVSCKSASRLQGIPLPPALQGNICIKRPYQGVTRSRDPPEVPRRLWKDLHSSRGNTMLWANALHDMSLNMVLSKATSLGTAPGPIPDLRFVKATVVMKSRPDSVRLKDWLGFCALVERLLSTDDFVKYVCNGTPQAYWLSLRRETS